MGRLLSQHAGKNAELIGPVQRRYKYDAVGNLRQTDNNRFGITQYQYDALGRIEQAGAERFEFDPAHNIIDRLDNNEISEQSPNLHPISGNRLQRYQSYEYEYDALGNLIKRTSPDGKRLFLSYDADNQLTDAYIEQEDGHTQQWRYRYDPFGRRISKTRIDARRGSHNHHRDFVWDGTRLLQEQSSEHRYTYIYRDEGSYEPLAQVQQQFGFNEDEQFNPISVLYYHTDQIGIPRELTDANGELAWYGTYSAWGKLTEQSVLKPQLHQPFRLQNQYCDDETGLHYNFFRYYDPECGRFTQQDPIGLKGGDNLYRFAANTSNYIDPLGLLSIAACANPVNAAACAAAGITVTRPVSSLMTTTTAAGAAAATVTATCPGGKCPNSCPPCPNPRYPKGSLGYTGPRNVQHGIHGARNNGGNPLSHYKLWKVNQIPSTCECVWGNAKDLGHHFLPADLNKAIAMGATDIMHLVPNPPNGKPIYR